MLNVQKFNEQRAEERFKIKGNAFVIVPPKSIPFCVLDISLKGLAFRYNYKGELPRHTSEMSLVFGNSDMRLHTLPVKTVSDRLVMDKSFVPMRRRGVAFEGLTQLQLSDLKRLIDSYREP